MISNSYVVESDFIMGLNEFLSMVNAIFDMLYVCVYVF